MVNKVKESSEQKILQLIKQYKTFLVTMHVNPDPDAIGSAVALTLFLRSIGKKVRLFNEGDCPPNLKFMPKAFLCEPLTGKKRFHPEVAIVLDCGDISRIGSVRELIKDDTCVVNIDHHVTNQKFGHVNHVQINYSSTSEILYQLLKEAKCHFTRDIAILLYLGILTDTGSFGFDCTSSHTHEVIADLLKFNFSVSDLYRLVYETMPKSNLKAFLSLLNRLELHFEDRLALLTMSEKEVAVFSIDFDLRDKVFGFLRSVKGLEAIVILTQHKKKKIRLNFRSRDKVDVSRLAEKFNGGGHRKAAGGIVEGSMKDAKIKVLREIRKVL